MSIRPRPNMPPKWHERLMRSGYFLAAVLLHLIIFLMIATLIIFKVPETPQDNTTFMAVPVKPKPPVPEEQASGGGSSANAMEPKLTVTPPSSALTVIHTAAASLFSSSAKPYMPSMTSANSNPDGSALPGHGASGQGQGPGAGNGNNPFGSWEGSNDMVGTLYDFTRSQSNDPVAVDSPTFKTIVQEFVQQGFQPAPGRTCYISPKKIHARQIFVPVTDDTVAGAAFGSPQSSNSFWLVHYKTDVTINTSGKFRFYGFGDNVLIVAIDGVVVLDASDLQYLGKSFNKLVGYMQIFGPGKLIPTQIFSGDSFRLDSAVQHHLDILIGDEGGVTTLGLFIKQEDKGTPIAFSPTNGAPMTPLFVVGAMTDADRQRISQDCPPEAMTTDLVFTGAPSHE